MPLFYLSKFIIKKLLKFAKEGIQITYNGI